MSVKLHLLELGQLDTLVGRPPLQIVSLLISFELGNLLSHLVHLRLQILDLLPLPQLILSDLGLNDHARLLLKTLLRLKVLLVLEIEITLLLTEVLFFFEGLAHTFLHGVRSISEHL